jgi:hypothetical protein
MLSEVEESNEKIAEANKVLAQINAVQASATKAGENAKAIIPIDIQFYFQEHDIESPNTNFTSPQDMLYYRDSPFGKRMIYLQNERQTNPGGMLGFLMQGLIKDQAEGEGGEGNALPSTLKTPDLLELGSMRYVYNKQAYNNINYGKLADSSVYVALSDLEHMKTYGSKNNVKGKKLWEIYWNERKHYYTHPEDRLKSPIRKFLDNYVLGNLQAFRGDGMSPFPDDNIGENSSSTDRHEYRLKNTAPARNAWSSGCHYSYTAGRAATAGGLDDDTYRNDRNSKGFLEALDLVCHQKFYKDYYANLTEPWYDWNAYIMLYKIEALSDAYGYEVTDIAMQYLLGSKAATTVKEDLNALLDPDGTREANGERVYSENEIIDIKAYIDGENLFGSEDIDIATERKEVLTYYWHHSDLRSDDYRIRGILDATMSSGATDLSVNEVALWSENLRIYIDKLTTDQQIVNTRMQRLLQRCNETSSLATQLLKVIMEGFKQVAHSIR